MEFRDRQSLLGFGCMRFPTNQEGALDVEGAMALLDLAYAGGVNYYDTAWPYHKGESEPLLGRWQETKPRESLLLATKMPVWQVASQEEGEKLFSTQLERLRTGYVDRYLLHGLDAQRWKMVRERGLLELLDRWKSQGRAVKVGFSFHDHYPVFEEILAGYPWDFCQLQLNYMDTEIQAGLKGLALAREKGVPVMVMEPVKGGLLANPPQAALEEFQRVSPGQSPAAWALRWAAGLEGVQTVLSGMSARGQVEENLRLFEDFRPLSREEGEAVSLAVEAYKARTKVGCTGCDYCQPCPQGVPIPSIFHLWNKGAIFQQEEASRQAYNALETDASFCVDCGQCVERCPQGLDIPMELNQAHQELWEP